MPVSSSSRSRHNIAKHSAVRHFEAELWRRADEIHLRVSDPGAGFDTQVANEGGGLGLASMRERLKLVNEELSVKSQPKQGCTIRARVPLGLGNNAERAAG